MEEMSVLSTEDTVQRSLSSGSLTPLRMRHCSLIRMWHDTLIELARIQATVSGGPMIAHKWASSGRLAVFTQRRPMPLRPPAAAIAPASLLPSPIRHQVPYHRSTSRPFAENSNPCGTGSQHFWKPFSLMAAQNGSVVVRA